MFNRISNAKSVMINDNTAAIVAGQMVGLGNDMIGVSQSTSALEPGNNITIHLDGAFGGIPMNPGDTPAVGDKLYWNGTVLTTTSGGNVWAGWCFAAPVGNTVSVKLKG